MSSNYSIIIDKGGRHEYYVCHILRDILSGPNSTFNSLIEIDKDAWYTGTELPAGELINNTNDK